MRRKQYFIITVLSFFLYSSLIFSVGATSTIWLQTYDGGDHDYGRCVIETSDGGFALAGYAYLGGKDDAWLVKTDADGNEQWKQNYGGVEWDEAYSVVQTSDGRYALAGYTKSYGEESGDFWLVW